MAQIESENGIEEFNDDSSIESDNESSLWLGQTKQKNGQDNDDPAVSSVWFCSQMMKIKTKKMM